MGQNILFIGLKLRLALMVDSETYIPVDFNSKFLKCIFSSI